MPGQERQIPPHLYEDVGSQTGTIMRRQDIFQKQNEGVPLSALAGPWLNNPFQLMQRLAEHRAWREASSRQRHVLLY